MEKNRGTGYIFRFPPSPGRLLGDRGKELWGDYFSPVVEENEQSDGDNEAEGSYLA